MFESVSVSLLRSLEYLDSIEKYSQVEDESEKNHLISTLQTPLMIELTDYGKENLSNARYFVNPKASRTITEPVSRVSYLFTLELQ